jgi:hypothetical protein
MVIQAIFVVELAIRLLAYAPPRGALLPRRCT